MKIYKTSLSDKPKDNYVQVYLSEEEYKKESNLEIIKQYKEKKYKIAYFIEGPKDYPEILKNIILGRIEKNETL